MDQIKTSFEFAKEVLPKRSADSNKGTYGRLFIYAGSERYKGALHLALESALRGGVGYVEVGAAGELLASLLPKFPEAIYKKYPEAEKLSANEMDRLISDQRRATATLVGCGCGASPVLYELIERLLLEDGGTLVIDADAINSLALQKEQALQLIKNSVRKVILTPHPLEFSRLTGISVQDIERDRVGIAADFAKRYSATLLLKGNGSVIASEDELYVNASGSSALAKAGSGDALAGLIGALAATKVLSPAKLTALAAYIHGRAADTLALEYSQYGVTPSDLPVAMARVIREIEKTKEETNE